MQNAMVKSKTKMTKSRITNIINSIAYSIRILPHLNPSSRLSYKKDNMGQIHIYGNGPSLKGLLCSNDYSSNDKVVFVVNDFAVSEYYSVVRPRYYMLIDPAYWDDVVNPEDKALREDVYLNMNQMTDWPMTLFVPSKVERKKLIRRFVHNEKIQVKAFNYTNFYPSKTGFYKFILKQNFGVVPVGNVLGQTIYASINLGYDEILVYGAEHSWTEDIRVNEKNEVCTIKKHFFESKENELVPWKKSNGDIFNMYEVLYSLGHHFHGYFFLEWYSKQMGAKIYNCTPDSFIDAFERKQLID